MSVVERFASKGEGQKSGGDDFPFAEQTDATCSYNMALESRHDLVTRLFCSLISACDHDI
jgi:hypothetical protein